jgi:hypothetical protein
VDPILSQFNPVYVLLIKLFKINVNNLEYIKSAVVYIQANAYMSVEKSTVAALYSIVLSNTLKLFIFNFALFNYL